MTKNSIKNESGRATAYAVILVGGKGKRLRPLSTDIKPKAFISVTRDRKTMFRKTIDRVSRIVPYSNVVVVANKLHSGLVKESFGNIGRSNLLTEPVSRNTAPAVAFAASVLNKRNPESVMIVLPADHHITRINEYIKSLKNGIDFAANNDAVVVMGIHPDFPSTEYGYIRIHKAPGRKQALKVEKFTEKPDIKKAIGYIKSGHYLWNSGMFIFKARVMLHLIKLYAPEIDRVIHDPAGAARAYHKFPDISIDYAIMEKAHNIYCVKCKYGWQDVGSFASLKSVLKRESRRFIEKDGKILKIL